jgi:predicted RNA binding protein YcfA (HicA-like mRNA interferase family)
MGRSKQPTYRDLISLLEHLGFQDESVKGSHRAFRHAASKTLILLADLGSDDLVRGEDLISVRRHLDSKGLMDTRTFERRFPESVATRSMQ